MLSNLCAGKDFGAEGADFVHGWVDVVLFVCGPGGAGFAPGEKTAVVNQSQADTDGYRENVKKSIEQAFGD